MKAPRTKEQKNSLGYVLTEAELRIELEHQAELKRRQKAYDMLKEKEELLKHYENYRLGGNNDNSKELANFLSQKRQELTELSKNLAYGGELDINLRIKQEEDMEYSENDPVQYKSKEAYGNFFKVENNENDQSFIKPFIKGDSDREKRLKLREEERLRRLAGIPDSVYDKDYSNKVDIRSNPTRSTDIELPINQKAQSISYEISPLIERKPLLEVNINSKKQFEEQNQAKEAIKNYIYGTMQYDNLIRNSLEKADLSQLKEVDVLGNKGIDFLGAKGVAVEYQLPYIEKPLIRYLINNQVKQDDYQDMNSLQLKSNHQGSINMQLETNKEFKPERKPSIFEDRPDPIKDKLEKQRRYKQELDEQMRFKRQNSAKRGRYDNTGFIIREERDKGMNENMNGFSRGDNSLLDGRQQQTIITTSMDLNRKLLPPLGSITSLDEHEKKRRYANELMKQIIQKEQKQNSSSFGYKGRDSERLQNEKVSLEDKEGYNMENSSSIGFVNDKNQHQMMSMKSIQDMSQISKAAADYEKKRRYKEDLDQQIQAKKLKAELTKSPRVMPIRREIIEGENILSPKNNNSKIQSNENCNLNNNNNSQVKSQVQVLQSNYDKFFNRVDEETKQRKLKQEQEKQKLAEELRKQMQEKNEKKRLEKLRKEEEEMKEIMRLEQERQEIERREKEREAQKKQVMKENFIVENLNHGQIDQQYFRGNLQLQENSDMNKVNYELNGGGMVLSNEQKMIGQNLNNKFDMITKNPCKDQEYRMQELLPDTGNNIQHQEINSNSLYQQENPNLAIHKQLETVQAFPNFSSERVNLDKYPIQHHALEEKLLLEQYIKKIHEANLEKIHMEQEIQKLKKVLETSNLNLNDQAQILQAYLKTSNPYSMLNYPLLSISNTPFSVGAGPLNFIQQNQILAYLNALLLQQNQFTSLPLSFFQTHYSNQNPRLDALRLLLGGPKPESAIMDMYNKDMNNIGNIGNNIQYKNESGEMKLLEVVNGDMKPFNSLKQSLPSTSNYITNMGQSILEKSFMKDLEEFQKLNGQQSKVNVENQMYNQVLEPLNKPFANDLYMNGVNNDYDNQGNVMIPSKHVQNDDFEGNSRVLSIITRESNILLTSHSERNLKEETIKNYPINDNQLKIDRVTVGFPTCTLSPKELETNQVNQWLNSPDVVVNYQDTAKSTIASIKTIVNSPDLFRVEAKALAPFNYRLDLNLGALRMEPDNDYNGRKESISWVFSQNDGSGSNMSSKKLTKKMHTTNEIIEQEEEDNDGSFKGDGNSLGQINDIEIEEKRIELNIEDVNEDKSLIIADDDDDNEQMYSEGQYTDLGESINKQLQELKKDLEKLKDQRRQESNDNLERDNDYLAINRYLRGDNTEHQNNSTNNSNIVESISEKTESGNNDNTIKMSSIGQVEEQHSQIETLSQRFKENINNNLIEMGINPGIRYLYAESTPDDMIHKNRGQDFFKNMSVVSNISALQVGNRDIMINNSSGVSILAKFNINSTKQRLPNDRVQANEIGSYDNKNAQDDDRIRNVNRENKDVQDDNENRDCEYRIVIDNKLEEGKIDPLCTSISPTTISQKLTSIKLSSGDSSQNNLAKGVSLKSSPNEFINDMMKMVKSQQQYIYNPISSSTNTINEKKYRKPKAIDPFAKLNSNASTNSYYNDRLPSSYGCEKPHLPISERIPSARGNTYCHNKLGLINSKDSSNVGENIPNKNWTDIEIINKGILTEINDDNSEEITSNDKFKGDMNLISKRDSSPSKIVGKLASENDFVYKIPQENLESHNFTSLVPILDGSKKNKERSEMIVKRLESLLESLEEDNTINKELMNVYISDNTNDKIKELSEEDDHSKEIKRLTASKETLFKPFHTKSCSNRYIVPSDES